MWNTEKIVNTEMAIEPGLHFEQLEYLGFSGKHDLVHSIYKRIPVDQKDQYANKYIYAAVIFGGVEKMRKHLALGDEKTADEEKFLVSHTLDAFGLFCRETGIYPREFYECVLLWSSELIKLSLMDEAAACLGNAQEMKISKFPDLFARSLLLRTELHALLGQFTEASTILSFLAKKPYLIPDRNLIPQIYYHYGSVSLQTGDLLSYKELLFRGLRNFYTGLDHRKMFLDQIVKTYRRSYKVLLSREIMLRDRLLFLVHWLYFRFSRMRFLRRLKLKYLLLGYIYVLNYLRLESKVQERAVRSSPSRMFSAGRRMRFLADTKKNILVTRAMGGIGDLLMLTPALHLLKQKYPAEEIHLAVPRQYFPLFLHNDDVILLDIERQAIDPAHYKSWYNLTDCPAARVESRTAPKVKKSRVDIFISSLGRRGWFIKESDRRPRYFISEDEKLFQKKFWFEHELTGKPVIGIQLRSDETYRDYPHMRELVQKISAKYTVLLFDAQPIAGFDFDNVIKGDSFPLRQAFALARCCDAIIAPDSSFVHFAAAFDIPCVALFGPIDGKVRTKHYPYCQFVDVREELACVPCWRNEQIPCKLTGSRHSICLSLLKISRVINVLEIVLLMRNNENGNKK